MMRAVAAVLLLASCSDAAPDLPLALEVTSPERGTFADSDSVTVTGRVTDDDKVRVTVAGIEVVPAADGTFSATVPVVPGITVIETHAIGVDGTDLRDVRAVLAGTLAPSDGNAIAHVGARASAAALRTIGNGIAASAKAIDYTAAVQPLNPVYDDGGCLGAKINITQVASSDVRIGLVPKAGALSTDIAIHDLYVRLSASFKVACIGGSTTITLRASKARIQGDIGLRVASGKLTTSLPTATVGFEGFSIDIGGVPGAIESLLRGEARDGVARALASAIRDKVPPIADKALSGLLAKPIDVTVLDADTAIAIDPKAVSLTPEGLAIVVDTKLHVAGGEGGVFLATPTEITTQTLATARGLGVAIDDDVINQLFAGLWAAGAIDADVRIDSIPALGALLDDDARTLELALALPPTVRTDGGGLALSLGDLMVTARDEAGAEVHRMAISLRTELEVQPSQSGKILLTVGAPEVFAQMLAQSAAVQDPLTDGEVEALVAAVWGVVGVKADDALGKLPLPTIAGVTLGAPTVEGGSGLVLADIPVQ